MAQAESGDASFGLQVGWCHHTFDQERFKAGGVACGRVEDRGSSRPTQACSARRNQVLGLARADTPASASSGGGACGGVTPYVLCHSTVRQGTLRQAI